jgi:hypothetical protein
LLDDSALDRMMLATVAAAPNQPLEPTAGDSWFVESKQSSARRGSAAGRSAIETEAS